ncbi:hypothetical protein Mapa_002663 [Marchantia paleacea]|nr:hypothetical protein Mapa_002663 [Marchantia paleacea]
MDWRIKFTCRSPIRSLNASSSSPVHHLKAKLVRLVFPRFQTAASILLAKGFLVDTGDEVPSRWRFLHSQERGETFSDGVVGCWMMGIATQDILGT